MPIPYESIFDDPNVVKYIGDNADGSSEIVCSQRFAQSIMDRLNAVPIPCGLNPDQPAVGQSAIIMVSSMVDVNHVKNALKCWMIDNHVGDLESVA